MQFTILLHQNVQSKRNGKPLPKVCAGFAIIDQCVNNVDQNFLDIFRQMYKCVR